MRLSTRHLCIARLCGALLCCIAGTAQSQEHVERWSGQWAAEGLPFVVETRAREGRLAISPVHPTDQPWSTSNGRIGEDSATIEASYQGVSARILIRLITEDTAIARALSCSPEFHFVCTLVRNQQARFHRRTPAREQ